MSKPPFESEIRDYYSDLNLDKDRVDEILDAGQFAATARRWKQIAITASVGLVAMTLFAVSLFLNHSTQDRPLTKPVASSPEEIQKFEQTIVTQETEMDNDVENQKIDNKGVAPPVAYRLVAFRSHGNACPHCRATGKVYQELEQSLGDTPLEFIDFDLSDSTSRQKTDQRIDELLLTPLIDGRAETAFIALTGLDGKPIQEFKPSMGTKQITKQVRKFLKR